MKTKIKRTLVIEMDERTAKTIQNQLGTMYENLLKTWEPMSIDMGLMDLNHFWVSLGDFLGSRNQELEDQVIRSASLKVKAIIQKHEMGAKIWFYEKDMPLEELIANESDLYIHQRDVKGLILDNIYKDQIEAYNKGEIVKVQLDKKYFKK